VRGVPEGERFADRVGIGVPARQPLDVDLAQLPLFQRIALAVEEAAQLFGPAHIQPDLRKPDPVIDDHLFEIRQLPEEGGAFLGRAEAEDMFDHAAIVP
jgi:hypothetical protein